MEKIPQGWGISLGITFGVAFGAALGDVGIGLVIEMLVPVIKARITRIPMAFLVKGLQQLTWYVVYLHGPVSMEYVQAATPESSLIIGD